MVDRNTDYEDVFDMKIVDIKDSIHLTRITLGKIRHHQLMQSADMSRVSKRVSLVCRRGF